MAGELSLDEESFRNLLSAPEVWFSGSKLDVQWLILEHATTERVERSLSLVSVHHGHKTISLDDFSRHLPRGDRS